jgi:hypothetical protein
MAPHKGNRILCESNQQMTLPAQSSRPAADCQGKPAGWPRPKKLVDRFHETNQFKFPGPHPEEHRAAMRLEA